MKFLIGILLILIASITSNSVTLKKREDFPFKIKEKSKDGKMAKVVHARFRSVDHYLNKGKRNIEESFTNLVGGSAYGTYFIDIDVGTPSQTLQVVVDTGSTTLVLASSTCILNETKEACSVPISEGLSVGYNMNASSTSSFVECGDTNYCKAFESYGDGSSGGGYIVSDVVSLNYGLSAPSYIANLLYETNHLGNNQEITSDNSDGILGLAYPSIGNNGFPSVFDSLVLAGKVDNIFGMDLQVNGGRLDLGKIDTSSCKQPIQYTPIVEEEYYNIQIESITVEGTKATYPDKESQLSIVDSGTTYMLLPDTVYEAVMGGFKKYCNSHSTVMSLCGSNGLLNLPEGYCGAITDSDLNEIKAHYPPITFTFPLSSGGSFSVDIGGDAYVIYSPYDSPGYPYCATIGIVSSGTDILSILGDSFMKGVYTAFDRENKNIGFCSNYTKPKGVIWIAVGVSIGIVCLVACVILVVVMIKKRNNKQQHQQLQLHNYQKVDVEDEEAITVN